MVSQRVGRVFASTVLTEQSFKMFMTVQCMLLRPRYPFVAYNTVTIILNYADYVFSEYIT